MIDSAIDTSIKTCSSLNMTTTLVGRGVAPLTPDFVCAPEGCTDGIGEEDGSGDKHALVGLTCTGTCGDCESGYTEEPLPPVDQMRSLDEVMTYDNVHVVRRIAKELKLELPEAQQLFQDMLVFLY